MHHSHSVFRNQGSDATYVYDAVEEWSYKVSFPHECFGAVGIVAETSKSFMVTGGVTPGGEYPQEFYLYNTDESESTFTLVEGLALNPPRAHPVVVAVEGQDCP